MPQRANVTAIDVLDTFRANLINYVSKARPALEEVTSDVLRMRVWLENEQRLRWENELRRRTRALEEAQQALFSARISNLRDEASVEVMAFHRAKRAREEAEEKLRTLKHWLREFDNRVQPLVKQTEKLQTLLSNDLTQAIISLAQTIKTLDAYASTPPPSGAPAPSEAAPASDAAAASPNTP
jgi:hypothetical protein